MPAQGVHLNNEPPELCINRAPSDHIIWAHTLSGLFTTSSAYKLLVSCASPENASSSNLLPNRNF